MGRRTFARPEAAEIRGLLREKGVADRDRQKTLRSQLRRKYDFFISDFTADSDGFTASDFDRLVSAGTIKIAEPTPSASIEASSTPRAPIQRGSRTTLEDVLPAGLDVVICGTAVGHASARVGAYYAGRGNKFWSTLHHVGLTPRELTPAEFAELPRYGIGLSDLAKLVSGTDREVSSTEFDIPGFRKKIEAASPRVVAFNGKRAAEAFLGRKANYGKQPETIGNASVFVLPSTSGTAQGYWDQSHWQGLSRHIAARRDVL